MYITVDIENFAILREIGDQKNPDPVAAAILLDLAGIDYILAPFSPHKKYLRISDFQRLAEAIPQAFKIAITAHETSMQLINSISPSHVTFVPGREQATKEGGLNVLRLEAQLRNMLYQLKEQKITTAAFVDPDPKLINFCAKLGFYDIVLNSNSYANAKTDNELASEYARLAQSCLRADKHDMQVAVKGGLNHKNIIHLNNIKQLEEIIIDESFIARSALIGIEKAANEIKDKINFSNSKNLI